ncbi:MAG: helix-turn-helix domain-containing protein [Planctomycetota bacterium]|nr:helix-turn-helix domain-containing protein [Planctomycetota bacterium]
MTYDFSVLRKIRKHKGLTIAGLSKKCGVSCVALSKLERNQGNPELKTLDRIARALGMTSHHLLALTDRHRPTPAAEQTAKILGKATCRFVNLDGTRVFVIRAPKGAAGSEAAFHGDDYERCFVLEGRLKVVVRDSEYVLGPGQGMTWNSLFDHSYEALEHATFIKILTPKQV